MHVMGKAGVTLGRAVRMCGATMQHATRRGMDGGRPRVAPLCLRMCAEPQHVSTKIYGPVRPPLAAGPSEGEEGDRENTCLVSPGETAT